MPSLLSPTPSVIFSHTLLKQWVYLLSPSNRHSIFKPLISLPNFKRSNVLEIGSGTGVLPSLIFNHSEFKSISEELLCSWVSTDQESSIQILEKNLNRLNLNDGSSRLQISAKELDWNEAHELLKSKNERMIFTLRKNLFFSFNPRSQEEVNNRSTSNLISLHSTPPSFTYPSLIISLDCIFNPVLFQPLISTLNLLTEPNHTLVLLVIELRSEEMVREFLSEWLSFDEQHGEDQNRWRIRSLENEELGDDLLDEEIRQRLGTMGKGFALWVA